jgi:NADH-quinone oxidoreductase subunit G
MSANVTDICPTGALTTREFRFESRVWNLQTTDSVCNGCDVGCNLFIEQKSGKIFRYKPRVNPEVNDFWLCDYGRFSHERYETARVVVPKVMRDDYLGVASWGEALDAIEEALKATSGERIAVIASAEMTNEEAYLLKRLFGDQLGSKNLDVIVDPIGPIRMRSRDGWLEGTQAGPNFRGVQAVGIKAGGSVTAESLMTQGADGIDFLFISDAQFSARAKDPAVVANLRKAKFLVVESWEDGHPLAEAADVILPSTIFAEKEGTYTNLQGRVQRINQAYPPKGEALNDIDILRRIAARVAPGVTEFQVSYADEVYDRLVGSMPSFAILDGAESAGGTTAP